MKVTVTRSTPSKDNCLTMYLVETSLLNQKTKVKTQDSQLLVANVRESFEISVDPFATYAIRSEVRQIDYDGEMIVRQLVAHKCTVPHTAEVFSIEELRKLENKASYFVDQQPGGLQTISCFYRNKPPEYFEQITEERNGRMEPYIKDLNGDPKCPSNGCIKGLYFMGRPYKTSQTKLPPVSPFGRRRFIIPVHRMFNRQSKLYFSDFWCHYQKQHYVSVVVTQPGSETDKFCRRYLMELDKYNNCYLELQSNGTVEISTAVWVEILYTETIDVADECANHGAKMKNTHIIGRGKSRPLGMRKNKNCPICNMYLSPI